MDKPRCANCQHYRNHPRRFCIVHRAAVSPSACCPDHQPLDPAEVEQRELAKAEARQAWEEAHRREAERLEAREREEQTRREERSRELARQEAEAEAHRREQQRQQEQARLEAERQREIKRQRHQAQERERVLAIVRQIEAEVMEVQALDDGELLTRGGSSELRVMIGRNVDKLWRYYRDQVLTKAIQKA